VASRFPPGVTLSLAVETVSQKDPSCVRQNGCYPEEDLHNLFTGNKRKETALFGAQIMGSKWATRQRCFDYFMFVFNN